MTGNLWDSSEHRYVLYSKLPVSESNGTFQFQVTGSFPVWIQTGKHTYATLKQETHESLSVGLPSHGCACRFVNESPAPRYSPAADRRSTLAERALHFRVRNGNGCGLASMGAGGKFRPGKPQSSTFSVLTSEILDLRSYIRPLGAKSQISEQGGTR